MSPEEVIDLALERYERPLIGYARSITGDPESARDAVQETFLRLSRQNLAALERRLAPWLFFVCRARPCAKDRAVHRWSGRRGAPGGKSQPCGGGRILRGVGPLEMEDRPVATATKGDD